MCLYQINYTQDEEHKNHIEIINTSQTTINNLKLLIAMPLANLVTCTVIKSRGSLAFSPPVNLIELGNLSPHESAHFYYSLHSTDVVSSTDSEGALKQFKFLYDKEEPKT